MATKNQTKNDFWSPGPGCSKYWIRLSTGQLLIQWTASHWINWLYKSKYNGWLAVQWIKFCPVNNSHDSLHFLCKSNQDKKYLKKKKRSAKFSDISS